MDEATRSMARMTLTTALGVLQRHYRASADKAVAQYGLSQALVWPLLILGRLGGAVRPGVLADALGIEAPSLTRSLDQLVSAGLAERRSDPNDGRAKTIHITAVGEQVREQIEIVLRGLRAEVFDGVSDRDLAACLRVFVHMGKRLDCAIPSIPLLDGVDDEAGRP
ncbi:MarR family winged helix-turn-helix transcriptional regulator [Variovorax sp.]|uniref:MarR family winged helix-turn-helix transcriptional regulator n=1 Tax=Variovorax sp. TaxID=1871043 RepID=UPI002D334D36|nr:MarR family transcriptional regulator [Variovorax sp.]HYP86263.1 MarR family transcriptional regulator [Variovorax sp.]